MNHLKKATAPYVYAAKTSFLTGFAYRLEVFSGFISNLIIMAAMVYFWRSAYAGQALVGGVSAEQMVTYAVLVSLMQILMHCETGDVLGDRIRTGNVALDLLKPVNIYGIYFAQDVGKMAVSLLVKALPLLLFSMLFIHLMPPVSAIGFLLFLLSSVLSYFILWFISAIVGQLTFWAMNVGPLGYISEVITRILSGSIVPIWFFPPVVRQIVQFTPFVYTYQLAAGAYIGKTGALETLSGNLIQLLWIGILYGFYRLLAAKATTRVLVQGG